MLKYREIVDGIFLEFPNHFIAYVGVNGTVETALRELSEGVIEKLKLLTDAEFAELEFPLDRKSTRLNSSHNLRSRMPSSA